MRKIKWEYHKVVVFYRGSCAAEDYQKLQRHGEMGWEAYYVMIVDHTEVYYMKKRVSDV